MTKLLCPETDCKAEIGDKQIETLLSDDIYNKYMSLKTDGNNNPKVMVQDRVVIGNRANRQYV